jgi:hypothetical protein
MIVKEGRHLSASADPFRNIILDSDIRTISVLLRGSAGTLLQSVRISGIRQRGINWRRLVALASKTHNSGDRILLLCT